MIMRNKQLRLVNLRVRGSTGGVTLIPLTPGANNVADKHRPLVMKDAFCKYLIDNDQLSIDPEIKGKTKTTTETDKL